MSASVSKSSTANCLEHWGRSIILHGVVIATLLLLSHAIPLLQPAAKVSQWDVTVSESVAPLPQPVVVPPPAPKPQPTPPVKLAPVHAVHTPIAAPPLRTVPKPRLHFVSKPKPVTTTPIREIRQSSVPIPPSPDPAPTPPVVEPLANSAQLGKALWELMNGRKRYPLLARRMGAEGTVVIEVVIDANGQIVTASITQSSGSSILDDDAMKLLRSVTPLRLERFRLSNRTTIRIPLSYTLK